VSVVRRGRGGSRDSCGGQREREESAERRVEDVDAVEVDVSSGASVFEVWYGESGDVARRSGGEGTRREGDVVGFLPSVIFSGCDDAGGDRS